MDTMHFQDNHRKRMKWLLIVTAWATFALSSKILASILTEYAHYFPPDFNAEFLLGRQSYFFGSYGLAFYAHIITSPVALILGAWLMWTGRRHRKKTWHRRLGKTQGILILALVVPSGLVMSTRAISGPAAGLGFACLSIALLVSMLAAIREARKRNFARHELWATRCFILLCSPLLLRLINGAALVTQTQSPWIYQLSAWLSWLVPLAIFEWVRHLRRQPQSGLSAESTSHLLLAKPKQLNSTRTREF